MSAGIRPALYDRSAGKGEVFKLIALDRLEEWIAHLLPFIGISLDALLQLLLHLGVDPRMSSHIPICFTYFIRASDSSGSIS